MARRMATALTLAGLLLLMPLATAQTVTMRRMPRPTRPMRVEANLADADFIVPGTVQPAGSKDEQANEPDVPVIGGPETIRPVVEETHSPELSTPASELPAPAPTAPQTDSPSSVPPNAPTNVGQTGNTVKAHSTLRPTLTITPMPTGTPTPTGLQTPTSTPSATKPPLSPSTREPVPPTSSPEFATLPPQPQAPQAIESAITRPDKTWPLIVFVGGIAAVAGVIVVLLWRDTRFPTQRTSQDGTASMQNKTGSGELEYDWYASSPSLSSSHHSVDTFMGRQQARLQSDPHVSSRAASTVDLLNVSTVGDRSTGSNSNRTARSQPIQEEQEADIKSLHANVADAFRSRDTLPRVRVESDESSSAHLSFDDEVNALSNWSGSDADTSVQGIFDEHHRAYLQSQGNTMMYTSGGGGSAFSPTSTDGGDDYESDHNDSEELDSVGSGSDDEDDRMPRRYSNGSAYTAVPSFSTAILGECSFISSTRSDWSDLTLPASERGSRRSLGSQDELE